MIYIYTYIYNIYIEESSRSYMYFHITSCSPLNEAQVSFAKFKLIQSPYNFSLKNNTLILHLI